MIIHFYIKSDQKHWHGLRHIAVFYFAECEPSFMFAITNWVRTMYLDNSIGTVFYNDWDWSSEQGTMRIESSMGCDIETLREACTKIVEFVHEIDSENICRFCKGK